MYTYYIGKITSITNTALELKLYVGGLFHTDSGFNVISKYYIRLLNYSSRMTKFYAGFISVK